MILEIKSDLAHVVISMRDAFDRSLNRFKNKMEILRLPTIKTNFLDKVIVGLRKKCLRLS